MQLFSLEETIRTSAFYVLHIKSEIFIKAFNHVDGITSGVLPKMLLSLGALVISAFVTQLITEQNGDTCGSCTQRNSLWENSW